MHNRLFQLRVHLHIRKRAARDRILLKQVLLYLHQGAHVVQVSSDPKAAAFISANASVSISKSLTPWHFLITVVCK